MDIFSIPLYYIGFNKSPTLEENLKKIGFKDIHHFQAIDGRKMKPEKLLKNEIISIRAYNDLVYGRDQHTGISSLGTIGCTLSHLELWKLCKSSLPYIVIVEDDLIPSNLSKSDINNIKNALKEQNGAFISSNVRTGDELLFGLHFYFLTKGAATNLVKKALPIDMQTDHYVGNINNTGDINAKGYNIGSPKLRKSSTRGNICIKCILPRGVLFYLLVCAGIILLICMSIFLYKKFKHTKSELDSCRSSQLSND